MLKALIGTTLVLAITTSAAGAVQPQPAPQELPYESLGVCKLCEKGEVVLSYIHYSPWAVIDYTECTASTASDHKDKICEQYTIKIYECTNCEIGTVREPEAQQKGVCPYF